MGGGGRKVKVVGRCGWEVQDKTQKECLLLDHYRRITV